MKTIEQLMKPRYRVIAGYPGNQFPVGTILEIIPNTTTPVFSFPDWKPGMPDIPAEEIELFPHLFTPVPWGEARKVEDVPKYLLFTKRIGKQYFQCVAKVIRIYTRRGTVTKVIGDDEPKKTYWLSSFDGPATAEEYEAYKKANP